MGVGRFPKSFIVSLRHRFTKAVSINGLIESLYCGVLIQFTDSYNFPQSAMVSCDSRSFDL